MNERIRELAELARQYAEEKQNDPLKIYTLDCFNEKFAQLLVQECIDAVYDDGQDAEYYQDRIKRHFGVE